MGLLDQDKRLVSVLGITPDHELPIGNEYEEIKEGKATSKFTYLTEQINQMKIILWRYRVDQLILESAETESEEQAEEKDRKLKANVKEMRQYVNGLTIMQTLLDELTSEA